MVLHPRPAVGTEATGAACYHFPVVRQAFPAAVLLALLPLPAPAASAAEELARKVEGRHRQLVDMTARFVQRYRSGLLGQEIVERGTMSLKQPGRMLWEYRDPERKTFVSDGSTCWFYVPADRQVVVRKQGGERGVALDLLSGRMDLLGQFEPGIETTAAGGRRLRLLPRKPDPDVSAVYLDVDRDGRINAIEILDTQENRSQFRFENVRENVGLPDSLFRFEVPPGVEVVSG
jgi:outer membrane lipoprotein carrier protein